MGFSSWEITLNLGQRLNKIMSFNINVFNSGNHFIQKRVNTCAILKDGTVGRNFCEI